MSSAAAVPSTGAGSILAPAAALWPLPPVQRAAAPFATHTGADGASTSNGGGRAPRPNFQFDLSDIERARSISYVSRLHAEPRCPLDPVYRLARVEERPVTPPRFVRDSLDCSDIERAHSTPVHSSPYVRPSASLDVSDLGAGARPRERYPPPRAGQSLRTAGLDARDITNTKFVSQRHTDPLDPTYVYGSSSALDVSSIVSQLPSKARIGGAEEESKEQSAQLVSFGPIAGAKPRQRPAARQEANSTLSLRTADISSPEAVRWSWTKPARTYFRDVTTTADVPGAQTGADRKRIYKTNRHTNPNERNYPTLGGQSVSDQAGMVHVHRHVLDHSPYAPAWRPSQGEPAPDAAGISMWRNGNFTAGMLAPKHAVAAAAAVAPAASSTSTKQPFGAPAEDGWMKENSAPTKPQPVRSATPVAASVSVQSDAASVELSSLSIPLSQLVNSPLPAVAAPSAAVAASSGIAPVASAASAANLSYPADARKAPPQQKRHHEGHNATVNILAHPQSNGREWVPAATTSERRPPLTFGLRGPFAVPSTRASIEETQATSTVSATSTAAASRSNSRPHSRMQTLPGSGVRPASAYSASSGPDLSSPIAAGDHHRSLLLSTLSPTSTTLANAFSMAFVPVTAGTTALPRTLPYSSPVARPGLGTIALFERGNKEAPRTNGATLFTQTQHRPLAATATPDGLSRAQERKMATMRAEEISQVRALC